MLTNTQPAHLQDPKEKSAKVTIQLAADSGYTAMQEARISAEQWGKICRVIEGTELAAAPTGAEGTQQQQTQAHVLPPTRGTGSQHEAGASVLTEAQILKALGTTTHEVPKRLPPGWLKFARAIEAELASRGRAQGGNTQASSADLSKLTLHAGKDIAVVYSYESEEFFLADDVRALLATHQPSTQAEGSNE